MSGKQWFRHLRQPDGTYKKTDEKAKKLSTEKMLQYLHDILFILEEEEQVSYLTTIEKENILEIMIAAKKILYKCMDKDI